MVEPIPEQDYRNYVMQTNDLFADLLERLTNLRLYSHENFTCLEKSSLLLNLEYEHFCANLVEPLTK